MPVNTASEYGNDKSKACCPDLSREVTAFLAVSSGKVGAAGFFFVVAPADEDSFRQGLVCAGRFPKPKN